MTGSVQDCGCIALPEQLQLKTGLYPGAKFQFELREDGSLLLIPTEKCQPQSPTPGVKCR